MNSLLNPHNNGPSLTGVIDVAAHSISLFQENEPPKNIIDIVTPKSDISIALPYDVIMAIMLLLCTSLLVVLVTQKWLV